MFLFYEDDNHQEHDDFLHMLADNDRLYAIWKHPTSKPADKRALFQSWYAELQQLDYIFAYICAKPKRNFTSELKSITTNAHCTPLSWSMTLSEACELDEMQKWDMQADEPSWAQFFLVYRLLRVCYSIAQHLQEPCRWKLVFPR